MQDLGTCVHVAQVGDDYCVLRPLTRKQHCNTFKFKNERTGTNMVFKLKQGVLKSGKTILDATTASIPADYVEKKLSFDAHDEWMFDNGDAFVILCADPLRAKLQKKFTYKAYVVDAGGYKRKQVYTSNAIQQLRVIFDDMCRVRHQLRVDRVVP